MSPIGEVGAVRSPTMSSAQAVQKFAGVAFFAAFRGDADINATDARLTRSYACECRLTGSSDRATVQQLRSEHQTAESRTIN